MLLAVATATLAMFLLLSKGCSPGLLKKNVKIETMFPQQKSVLPRNMNLFAPLMALPLIPIH